MDDFERGRILGHREAAGRACSCWKCGMALYVTAPFCEDGCSIDTEDVDMLDVPLVEGQIRALSALPSDLVVANLESLRYAIIATDQRCLPAYDSERFGLAWQDIYDTVQAARTRAALAKDTP